MQEVINKYKNKLSKFLKLNFLYPIMYKKVGQLKSIVPPIVFESAGISIAENVVFHNWNDFCHIGNYTFIGKNTFIDNCKSIGSFCSISFDVKIGLRNHNINTISSSQYFYKKYKGWVIEDNFSQENSVIIENDVLISANVVILDGVKIGTGAVIGAGALVNKNIPPYAIVAGVPAKIIRYRFDKETIKLLIESKWWINDKKVLKKLSKYFDNPIKFLKNLNI